MQFMRNKWRSFARAVSVLLVMVVSSVLVAPQSALAADPTPTPSQKGFDPVVKQLNDAGKNVDLSWLGGFSWLFTLFLGVGAVLVIAILGYAMFNAGSKMGFAGGNVAKFRAGLQAAKHGFMGAGLVAGTTSLILGTVGIFAIAFNG